MWMWRVSMDKKFKRGFGHWPITINLYQVRCFNESRSILILHSFFINICLRSCFINYSYTITLCHNYAKSLYMRIHKIYCVSMQVRSTMETKGTIFTKLFIEKTNFLQEKYSY